MHAALTYDRHPQFHTNGDLRLERRATGVARRADGASRGDLSAAAVVGKRSSKANRVQRRERKVTGERGGGEVSVAFCPNGFTEQCDEAAKAVSDNANALHEVREAVELGKLEEMTITDLAHRAQRLDRVTVTTMSSSKRLEFEAVFMLGSYEGVMPFWSSINDPAELEEDPRKFYVSVTLAMNAVKIFYSGSVVISSGWVKKTKPSRFSYEIGQLHH